MTTLYLVHDQTKRRFKVLRVEPDTKKIVLQGEHAEFEENYDVAAFKKLGYRMEKVED